MPLYEYVCTACRHTFEVIQKFSDAPVEVCPKCGGRVQKVLSSPAIQFKGTGWYITDYAKKGQAEAGKGGSDAPKSESAKTDAAKSSTTEASASAAASSTDAAKPTGGKDS
jgi:putative FmdB family regulatory protein